MTRPDMPDTDTVELFGLDGTGRTGGPFTWADVDVAAHCPIGYKVCHECRRPIRVIGGYFTGHKPELFDTRRAHCPGSGEAWTTTTPRVTTADIARELNPKRRSR